VSFFPNGPDRIFASLYAATEPRGLPGVVICPPWGSETYRLRDGCFGLAYRMAALGGAGLVFDWVGHGDSTGDPEDATPSRMAEIAAGAFATAERSAPGFAWGFGGVRLGAAAAAMAGKHAGSRAACLLLVQPALDAATHFSEVDRAARRASFGRRDGDKWAFGNPLPDLRSWPQVDAAAAIGEFAGPVAVVRFTQPSMDGLPSNVGDVPVTGSWKTGITGVGKPDFEPLIEAAVGWLARTPSGDRGANEAR
jgi:alpha-beta hydrolase superfamily lysophospholipase